MYYGTPQDTFVVYMSPDRGIGGTSTLYIKKGTWKYPREVLGDSLNASLGIDLIGCLVYDEEMVNDIDVLIYPQPGDNYIHIQLKGLNTHVDKLILYDMLGRKSIPKFSKDDEDQWTMQVSDQSPGIYILQIISGNKNISRRISIF